MILESWWALKFNALSSPSFYRRSQFNCWHVALHCTCFSLRSTIYRAQGGFCVYHNKNSIRLMMKSEKEKTISSRLSLVAVVVAEDYFFSLPVFVFILISYFMTKYFVVQCINNTKRLELSLQRFWAFNRLILHLRDKARVEPRIHHRYRWIYVASFSPQ